MSYLIVGSAAFVGGVYHDEVWSGIKWAWNWLWKKLNVMSVAPEK